MYLSMGERVFLPSRLENNDKRDPKGKLHIIYPIFHVAYATFP